MTMSGDGPEFVKWSEKFVSQERGRRVVHYYLEDSMGDSHLAVIGTERSLRHMVYVVSEEFFPVYGSDRLSASSLKWRSRREVVDWLASFLSVKAYDSPPPKLQKYRSRDDLGTQMEVNRSGDHGYRVVENVDRDHKSDIVWSGAPWTCGKQLQHYRSFCRDRTTIIVHAFVFVMAEEENRYLAYLEDMYENKKGEKKVKVRWFHQNQEFTCMIPAPAPHPREVFMTPYTQVISAECVDDIATVLTPEHYKKYLGTVPSSVGIRVCFRQYIKKKFKPFDLRTLHGYFNQAILSFLGICNESGRDEEIGCGSMMEHVGPRRTFGTDMSGHSTTSELTYNNLGYELCLQKPLPMKIVGRRSQLMPPYNVGEKIELLCQDSGIRGCWFKCTVSGLSPKKLKVHYDDVQNVDGYGNLEEWVPAFKTAAPDRLGMRCLGRLTIRPYPKYAHFLNSATLQKGMAVDVHWNDGWWEGVLVEVADSRDDNVQVYLPGEDIFLICELKRLRISRDWLGNHWVHVNAKPDILSTIFPVGPRTNTISCSTTTKRAESGSSVMSDEEMIAVQPDLIEEGNQMEATLSGRNPVRLKDDDGANPRKRLRDEETEDVCGAETGISSAES